MGKERNDGSGNAGAAIVMWVVSALRVETVVILTSRLLLVLMEVVAKMLRLAARLMLAIATHCSPTELQRHHHKQENR